MKYATIICLLALGSGLYVRSEQPEMWNQIIAWFSSQPAPQVAVATKVFVPPSPLPAKPNWVWTTVDGKVYTAVTVLKVEADCVTILDSDGGARIDISSLPVDLQRQLNYDPELASAASAKRAHDEQVSGDLMAKEQVLGDQVQQGKLAELGVEQAAMSEDGSSSGNSPQAQNNDADNSGTSAVYGGDYYSNDLYVVRRNLHLNSVTGRYEGNPEDMARYYRDSRAIDEQKRIRESNYAINSAHPTILSTGSYPGGSRIANGMPSNGIATDQGTVIRTEPVSASVMAPVAPPASMPTPPPQQTPPPKPTPMKP